MLDVSLEDGVTPFGTVFASVLSTILNCPVLDDDAKVHQGFEVADKMKQLDVEVTFTCAYA